jgi:hypothetical protein
MKRLYFTMLTSMVWLISGCSGLQTYHSDLDSNLQITTQTDSGSMLSSIHTAVDIHKVNPDCTTEYTGTIKLDDQAKDIGLPTGRSSYLVFVFERGGIFSTETSTSYDTLIRPRDGYQYTANVSYQDDIYNVILNEIDPGSKKSHDIAARGIHACRPI